MILRRVNKGGNLKNRQHALIMGVGLFITWLCSFLAPFLLPNLIEKVNISLILFGLILSISAGLMAFGVDYIILSLKSNTSSTIKKDSSKGRD